MFRSVLLKSRVLVSRAQPISKAALYSTQRFYFASQQPTQEQDNEVEIEVEQNQPSFGASESMEFKAETRKLLDIVAKSIYTDKEVFLRELLSNCSDALEKQRFLIASGQKQMGGVEDDLSITITTNAKERTIVIFDSGCGMTREEACDNLGTIARSGSQAFVKDLEDKGGVASDVSDQIIGQFGVGFYSSFVVSDHVEVITKKDNQNGVRWVSDGCGSYQISDATDLSFERGTKITLKLLPESREFCQETTVEKVIKKFSQFISYPIKLNGAITNSLGAVWYREKRDVTVDEYERFFEDLANTKIPYKYMLHYSTDVPLAIKALLYIPSSHSERQGLMQESMDIHLYSRKVLIKEKCSELLPHYLRFVKGVVDCEDLPLNISRENYQDSGLVSKLRNVLTRRVIKLIDDEAKRDADKYKTWYNEFGHFLKEGVTSDQENRDAILRLLRFKSRVGGDNALASIDDYISKMPEKQEKVYYISNQNFGHALNSPYMEPFNKRKDIDVLVLTHPVDEILFQQMGEYKGKKFMSIESSFEQIQKDLQGDSKDSESKSDLAAESKLPEDEVSSFCIWMQSELKESIGKVSISRRLTSTPALISGQMSSSMRMMMQMMEQQNPQGGQMDYSKFAADSTLELNASHPIIVNLNQVRKVDKSTAGLVAQQLLNNVMVQSGIPCDMQNSTAQKFQLLDNYLQLVVDSKPQQAERKQAKREEPVLKTAQRERREAQQEIIIEETVGK